MSSLETINSDGRDYAKNSQHNDVARFPTADEMRGWFAEAMLALETNPSAVGRLIGAGKNSFRDFMNKTGSEVWLGTVGKAHSALIKVAQESGKELPELPGGLSHGDF